MTYSYETFGKQLGAKLRKMRLERGWTIRHMIIQWGYHTAQWQRFEKGEGISVPSLLRLCEVFDLTLEQLIEGLGVEEPAASAPDSGAELPAKKKTAAKVSTRSAAASSEVG